MGGGAYIYHRPTHYRNCKQIWLSFGAPTVQFWYKRLHIWVIPYDENGLYGISGEWLVNGSATMCIYIYAIDVHIQQ